MEPVQDRAAKRNIDRKLYMLWDALDRRPGEFAADAKKVRSFIYQQRRKEKIQKQRLQKVN